MKIFEVTSEFSVGDSKEITKEIKYVSGTSLEVVTTHQARHCVEYEKDLKGVREILIVVEHIKDENI